MKNTKIIDAEKEINIILGEHITPDWFRVGELVRIAQW